MIKSILLLKKEMIIYRVNDGEVMAFIKHGDGKIVSIIDENNLTDEQKKALKEASLLADKAKESQINNSDKKLKN
jgi:hypothetical protein